MPLKLILGTKLTYPKLIPRITIIMMYICINTNRIKIMFVYLKVKSGEVFKPIYHINHLSTLSC